MELLYILIALVVGAALAWLLRGYQLLSRFGMSPEEAQSIKKENETLQSQVISLNAKTELLERTREELSAKTERLSSEKDELNKVAARQETELKNIREKLESQKEEVAELHARMTEQFKNLANEILDEKSKKFTDQNRTQIDQILKPLGEKLKDFEKKVEETYEKEMRDKTSLGMQIKQLVELNQKMSEDAQNLTKALKGDAKTQGNWGEVVLERILERSGLTKGQEYETQFSAKGEEGNRLQPDVVIHLPDEKYLVVDAKVSLTAYERYSSSADADGQKQFLREHIQSIKNHVKSLSGKNYASLFEKSPDFVLMFIPIEPAFGLAMINDPSVYNDAFDQKIVIVSPSTLLATLATIKNIWKYEYQNQNAQKIATEGANLYDKFVGFVSDLEEIGARLSKVQESHDNAMNKLSTGRGNLIGRAEKMRGMGLSTKKSLPAHLSDDGEDEEERDFTEEFK